MESDHVGFREYLFLRSRLLHLMLHREFLVPRDIVANLTHSKRLYSQGHLLPNPVETNDSDGLPHDLVPGDALPLARSREFGLHNQVFLQRQG